MGVVSEKSEKGKERSREAARAARGSRLQAARRWAGRILLAASLAGAVWGSAEIRARVRSEPRFDLSHWKIELGEVPAWAPPELRQEIEAIEIGGTPEAPLTVFTPRVLERVRDLLLGSPWVRSVPEIHLRYPRINPVINPGTSERAPGAETGENGAMADPAAGGERGGGVSATAFSSAGSIELSIALRVPIAAVQAAGRFFFLDREGVRLGQEVERPEVDRLHLAVIAGGEGRAPRRVPPCGMAFEDRDVREGLEVACVLADHRVLEEFPSLPAPTIDIQNVGERSRAGECEIVLALGDLRLGWGRSPISRGARTLSVPEILENLRRALRGSSGLPRGSLVLLYTSPLVVSHPTAPQER